MSSEILFCHLYLNNQVQACTTLSEMVIVKPFQRMWRSIPAAPVEGFGLVTKNVTRFFMSAVRSHCNGKGIGSIVLSRGHGKANDYRGAFIEILWG